MMCSKCSKMSGYLFVILGVLFLLVDFGTWTFWNISWWTALFLVWGIGCIAKSGCPACCAAMKK